MNITYIIGLVFSFAVMILGMMFGETDAGAFALKLDQLGNFIDVASILIVVGCTLGTIVASFPIKTVASLPKHFKVLLNVKKNNPNYYIDQLVELAQKARKDGLLSLEEMANNQNDLFFKQAIMLIVDANDPDRVRAILENDIECMTERHEATAAMYDKGGAVAPAFGMIGTLVGLINMLANMNLDAGGSSSIGADMAVALITTLYGCILAHMVFGPIANNLRERDAEEVLCKMIIVEGITCIQAGENPKLLKEKLQTFVAEQSRESSLGAKGKKEKKGKKGKGSDEE